MSVLIPEDLKLHFSQVHKEVLLASQTQIQGTLETTASVVFCSYCYICNDYTRFAQLQFSLGS